MVQPWWPLALLAVIQLCDALLCVKPVAFIRQCLTDVRFPERFWKFLPRSRLPQRLGSSSGSGFRRWRCSCLRRWSATSRWRSRRTSAPAISVATCS